MTMIQRSTILHGDVFDVLPTIEAESVHCCVTSPPYWALRDYGVDGQLGLEKTPEEYIERMVCVFREVRKVLRKDGTLWLNIGDSYASSPAGNFGAAMTRPGDGGAYRDNKPRIDWKLAGVKPKDLVGIPWMLAFALRADGWYLRSDIIWAKPNPMPESVTDRPTKAHEYLFLLSKSATYYYDAEAIREKGAGTKLTVPAGWATEGDHTAVAWNKERRTDKQRGHSRRHAGFNDRWDLMDKEEQAANGRNKRTVWEIATHPYPEAHFATFPPDLVKPCILAGSPPDGVVLDPFTGSGTTGQVALQYGRQFLGVELNPEYIRLAEKRLAPFIAQPLLEFA